MPIQRPAQASACYPSSEVQPQQPGYSSSQRSRVEGLRCSTSPTPQARRLRGSRSYVRNTRRPWTLPSTNRYVYKLAGDVNPALGAMNGQLACEVTDCLTPRSHIDERELMSPRTAARSVKRQRIGSCQTPPANRAVWGIVAPASSANELLGVDSGPRSVPGVAPAADQTPRSPATSPTPKARRLGGLGPCQPESM